MFPAGLKANFSGVIVISRVIVTFYPQVNIHVHLMWSRFTYHSAEMYHCLFVFECRTLFVAVSNRRGFCMFLTHIFATFLVLYLQFIHVIGVTFTWIQCVLNVCFIKKRKKRMNFFLKLQYNFIINTCDGPNFGGAPWWWSYHFWMQLLLFFIQLGMLHEKYLAASSPGFMGVYRQLLICKEGHCCCSAVIWCQ